MPEKLQTLSRSDTSHLRSGVCPACNGIHFIIGGLYHHERGCFRRVLCLQCKREFGVSPANGGEAVILSFCMPNHKLAQIYNIHTGTFPASDAIGINPERKPQQLANAHE